MGQKFSWLTIKVWVRLGCYASMLAIFSTIMVTLQPNTNTKNAW